MNRIQLLDDENTNSRHKKKLSPRSPRRDRPQVGNSACDPCFFVPLHYEPNYAYPLLVWLHGPNDGGCQLNDVMPHVSVRNYVGVGVSLPSNLAGQEWRQDAKGICESFAAVEESVRQSTERFNVASDRIFLAGYDRGGTMALRLGLAAPSQFAGAASLGGPAPVGHHPLSNVVEARALPIMIAHGRDSQCYSVEQLCSELKLFHAAGMSLNLRQYPCGQELTTQMLSDLDAWLMQIVTGTAPVRTNVRPDGHFVPEN